MQRSSRMNLATIIFIRATAHCVLVGFLFAAAPVRAQQDSQVDKTSDAKAADQVAQATAFLNKQQTYQLQYKLKKGDVLRWNVQHVVRTSNSEKGHSVQTASRTQSVKAWRVENVDARGQMTFSHVNEKVKTWSKSGEDEAIAYDSTSEKEPAKKYRTVHSTIGAPLISYTIRSNGTVVQRKSDFPDMSFGTGGATIPLPSHPIAIGYQWHVPKTLTLKKRNKEVRQVKIRTRYELKAVKDGKAFITHSTEVLTPNVTAALRSQMIQHMTQGTRVFDIQAGRLVSCEIEWDQKVQGYNGDDSFLEYLAKYSEDYFDQKVEAATLQYNPRVGQRLEIKTSEGKPIMRRY